jgi:hypothetical protein
MPWPMNTRLKQYPLPSQSTASLTGAVLNFDLPKTGFLSALTVLITGTLTGTPSTPNALGMANLIGRVRLIANAGIDIVNVSGVGYHYGLRDYLGSLVDPVPQASARNAVESGALDLSMYFPIAMNDRDPIGLINLQNEDTQLRLQVEVNAATQLANDFSALSLTVAPHAEIFSAPVDPKDWPPFLFAHTMTEEQQTVAAAGDVNWPWPRGGIYAQVLHLLGVGAAGADAYSRLTVRIDQTNNIIDATPAYLSRLISRYRGRTRVAGVAPIDLLSWSGLGNFGSGRDLIDTRELTDITSILVATSAVTMRTVKRQLIPLRQPGQ